MAERFTGSEKPLVIKQASLEERLKEYPELKTKMENMLALIENAGGEVEKAAEAERRLSRNCGRWETRFFTVGHVVSNRK